MLKRLWVACLLVTGLLLAACAQDSGTPEIAPSLVPLATVATQMAAAAGAGATPVGAAASTPAVQEPQASSTEPTPSQSITVADQELNDDGRLVIDRVEASQPGWLVIYGDDNGQPGQVLGHAEIAQGINQDVLVEVDPLQSTPHLFAQLHLDEGESGVFESPGPDRPVQIDSEVVSADLMVEISVHVPSVTVADQPLSDDETITIDSVVAAHKGWIVLHADEDGQPGRMLAYLPVESGESTGLVMNFNWRAATPRLHAVLHEDDGQQDVFEEPAIDVPVELDGQPVSASFLVTLPPDIYVLDQPVVDGEIVVERVISYGPGWIVLYHDDEGGLGNIIGWAHLDDGINENIRFPVVESAVTPLLHLMIHQDLDEIGEFEFPRTDPPVLYQDRVPNPVTFRTDSGNYLITTDQSVSASGVITLPLVVVDHDAFAVIRVDDDGQPGEIWGLRWVPGGVNRDVRIELADGLNSDILYAELYLDAISDRKFDYPDGLDIIMQRNRAQIRAWFNVLPAEDS